MKWETARIGEITNNLDRERIPLNSIERKEKKDGKAYPYIGANGVVDYINDFIFDEKILCVAEDGGDWGYQKKCAFIINQKCWVNNHAHVLTSNGKVNLNFLKYYLNFQDLTKYITGTTRGKLNQKKLQAIEIPLPPLAEQERIAAILDKADALRARTRTQLAAYDELLQAVFLEMFGDPFNNQKGFPKGTIRDLIKEAKYGTSKKAGTEGQYKYLRMNNITYGGDLNLNSLKYIDLERKEIDKYTVKNGDILFNRTNSKELVGKTTVFDQDETMVIAGYIIRVRANTIANPYYIAGYLNSEHGKLILQNMCKNIVGMANINAQELQDIKILIPPIELQDAFESIVNKVKHQKQKVQSQLTQSDDLFNSLLQRAFRGEL